MSIENALLEHAKALTTLAEAIRGMSVPATTAAPAPLTAVQAAEALKGSANKEPQFGPKEDEPKKKVKKEEPKVEEQKKEEPKKEEATTATEEFPTVEDVIDVFTQYLPKDLDADERSRRHKFVRPMLQRFGVEKATAIAPENRALAIDLVKRKMAGEDIDPERANFADESLV